MSQWTHVAGMIRYDGISFDLSQDQLVEKIESLIGEQDDYWGIPDEYRDEGEKKPKLLLPTGSEGPVDWFIHKHRSTSCVNFCQLAFWGDLRDYSNVEELLEWFKRLCNPEFDESAFLSVRQATMTIQVEYKGTWNYSLDEDDNIHETHQPWNHKEVGSD